MFSWVCPRCGHEVPPSKTECPFCSPPAPEPIATQGPYAPPPPQQYQPPPPPQQTPLSQQAPPPPYAPPQQAPPQYAQQAPPQYWQPQGPPPPQQYPPPPQAPPPQYAPPQQAPPQYAQQAPPQYWQAQYPPQQYPPQQYQPVQEPPPPQYQPPPPPPQAPPEPQYVQQQQPPQYTPPPPQYTPPAPVAEYKPETAQNAPTPWPPPEEQAGKPAWLVAALAFGGVLALLGLVYFLIPHGSSSAKDAAKLQTTNPMQKYIEVVGLRIVGEKGGESVKFLVVNHQGVEVADLTANVTLWASTQRSEEDSVGTFTFHVDTLGPNGSKELSAPLKTDKGPADMPDDWRNITADVQVTSTQ